MKYILQLLVSAFCFCSCSSQPVVILPVPIAREIDTIKHDEFLSSYRTDYFLIQTSLNSEEVVKDSIAVYVERNLDSSLFKYNQYDMRFYLESRDLNLDLIEKLNQKYKAFIDKKPFLVYTWFEGKLVVHRL